MRSSSLGLKRVLLAGFLAILVLLPAAYAQSNAISLQGCLTNADGTPVPDGTYEPTFARYASETGGTPLWSETELFSILNGSVAQDWDLFVFDFDATDPNVWLELTVEGETLSPHTRVTSVPFALQARRLGSDALEAGANVWAASSRFIVTLGFWAAVPPDAPAPTAIEAVASDAVPTQFVLDQNYPNPFNPAARIRYALPTSEQVRLAIYDVLGREVTVLVDRQQAPGTYEATFEAGDLPSGVYFYRLETGPFSEIRQMLLVK